MNTPQIKEVLQKGIRAARRGRKEPAQRLLAQAIQADPDNEEAWLWMSRVVDTPAERAECLNRVLQLNPDNRWAAEQLAELQAAPTAEGAEATSEAPSMTTPSKIEIEVLQCPNCGGALELQGGGEAKTLVCNHCGSVLDLTAEQAAIIGQTNQGIKPALPIELGMEGTFKGEVHQVIGWVRYEGWDDEERWQWEEWLLLSASGKFRWLTYDAESGFILQNKVQPLSAFNPRTATSFKVPGGTAHVIERGQAKIVALAGELTWRGTVDDQITYLDAERDNVSYSVEYTNEELEVFSGRPLSAAKVWAAFGREDLAEAARQHAEGSIIHWQTVYLVGAIFAFILAVLTVFALLFAGGTGRQIVNNQITLAQGESSIKTLGPINFTQSGAYRVTLQAQDMGVNQSARVSASLYNNQNQDFTIFSAQLQSGTGSKSTHLFKPTQRGQYSLRVSLVEGTGQSLPLTVTVEQGVWSSSYLIMFLFISGFFIILFIVLFFRQRSRVASEEDG